MRNKTKKILVIGSYDKNYPRNKVLMSTLGELFEISKFRIKNRNLIERIKSAFNIFRLARNCDYVFLANSLSFRPLILITFFLKIILKKKIIFDAFVSIYDSFVFDRKYVKEDSLRARYYYLLDYFPMNYADIVVYDTNENAEYFKSIFKIKKTVKNIVWPVSVDLKMFDDINASGVLEKNKFNILFYGYFIPLQGIEYIVKAAKLIESENNIHFTIIGSGQNSKKINKLISKLNLKNLTLVSRIEYSDLLSRIKEANMCLGIFGKTDKAKRVIPNKLIDCMACRKVVITGKNKEMVRYFTDKKDLIYCNLADSEDLAKKIIEVYKNFEQYKQIENNAYKAIKNNFSNKILKQIIIKYLS